LSGVETIRLEKLQLIILNPYGNFVTEQLQRQGTENLAKEEPTNKDTDIEAQRSLRPSSR